MRYLLAQVVFVTLLVCLLFGHFQESLWSSSVHRKSGNEEGPPQRQPVLKSWYHPKKTNYTAADDYIEDMFSYVLSLSRSNPSATSRLSAKDYAKKIHVSVKEKRGGPFTVGDVLQVDLSAKDDGDNTVLNVGDFFRASIHTLSSNSSAAGIVKDNKNGSYTVTFRLLWEGTVTIKIVLVNPRQAVDVIERSAREYPVGKIMFYKRYVIGSKNVDTMCDIDPGTLKHHPHGVCDYSDKHAGPGWFCEKAENIPCSAPGFHGARYFRSDARRARDGESKYFGSDMNAAKIVINGSLSSVAVKKGTDPLANRPRCSPGLPTPPISGFYRQDVWQSLVCENRHFSTPSEWKQCLQNKTLHMLGDSTVRQYFEHLVSLLKMKEIQIPYAIHQSGPLLAHDPSSNITLRFRFHGPPALVKPMHDFLHEWITSCIDQIKGGPDVVVIITIWAHLTTYPLKVYVERITAIRASVQRLLRRSPDTTVVIKSANTRMGNELVFGDWVAYKVDLAMRKAFKGMEVVLVDAWEMTSAHRNRDDVHPKSVIVRQELEYLCSFICNTSTK